MGHAQSDKCPLSSGNEGSSMDEIENVHLFSSYITFFYIISTMSNTMKKTVKLSDRVYRELSRRGAVGDTYDDVIAKLLKLKN